MWLYEKNIDNTARFVLGTKGKRPLVCFGINPSTATPNALDATLRCVQNVSLANPQFDSFVMLNIYPQRATNPDELHKDFLYELKSKNEYYISKLIGEKTCTLWAAWGALIEKRPYLTHLLRSILNLPELQNNAWLSRGKVTKKGHPHHPLYVKSGTPFETFDMELYKKSLNLSP